MVSAGGKAEPSLDDRAGNAVLPACRNQFIVRRAIGPTVFDGTRTLRRADRPAVAVGIGLVVAGVVPMAGDAGTELLRVPLDKWLHAVGYAVLTWLVARARAERAGGVAVAVVLAVGWGLGVELLQLAVPTRATSVLDAVANGVGALAGGFGYVSAALDG